MFKRILQLNHKKRLSQKGSVLSVAFVVMAVLAASTAAITQATVNQITSTNIKVDTINDEVIGKRLIQQAIGEFEAYIDPDVLPDGDFNSYESNEIPLVAQNYNVIVTNMTGTPGFEDFGVEGSTETRAYRFAYTLDTGVDMVMYSYVSNVGSTVEQYNPFDFSIGTNGDLILTSGYYRQAAFYAESIYYNYRAAYPETVGASTYPDYTPSTSGYYPDFNGNGNGSDIFYRNDYLYCVDLCFEYNVLEDPIEIDKTKYIDIFGSGLETGDYTQDTIISDFFGNFDYDQVVIDFVKDTGPTDSLVITDSMNINNIADVVMNNSSPGQETCFLIWCWTEASSDPYTDLTNDIYFNPLSEEEYLDYGAVYDGNLTVQQGLHMMDRDEETLIITGDLIFDNIGAITVDGKFVVLGDLIFQGDELDIDGSFYVLGQTFFNFNEGEGISEAGSTNEYGLTFMTKDNIIINSIWESHTSSQLPDQFDVFMYTEESIYIEAVNSRLNIDGVLFANAKGVSGNYIPMVDENSNPILGIVMSAYRGRINSSGTAVPSSNRNRNSFYLDVVNNTALQDAFTEIPTFDTLVITEGVYTFERSEFLYE